MAMRSSWLLLVLASAFVLSSASNEWINIRVYNEGPLETVGLYYGSSADSMLATIGPHGTVLSTVALNLASGNPLRVRSWFILVYLAGFIVACVSDSWCL